MTQLKEQRSRRQSVAVQAVYQPGDGTRYYFHWVTLPPSPDGGPEQTLINVKVGEIGRSMTVNMTPENVLQDGFLLHPTYVEEKFGGSPYLARITAHFFNMKFCKTYWRILDKLTMGTEGERQRFLPRMLWETEAIEAEIESAQPSRVALYLAEMEAETPPGGELDKRLVHLVEEVEAFNSTILARAIRSGGVPQ